MDSKAVLNFKKNSKQRLHKSAVAMSSVCLMLAIVGYESSLQLIDQIENRKRSKDSDEEEDHNKAFFRF